MRELAHENRGWLLAAAAVIVLAGAAIYAPTLSAPFIFDDRLSIADNPTIRQLWPPGPALSPPRGEGLTVEGRPILNYSLAINYAISGLHPWSYHALNVLIHLGAGLTLFGIIRRTLCRLPGASTSRGGSAAPATSEHRASPPPTTAGFLAFGAALLWTVHPLQTESVTYVIQRAESLMGLFFLLTLYCFIRGADPFSRNNKHGVAAEACPPSGVACPPWRVTRQASPAHQSPRLLTSAATFDCIVTAEAADSGTRGVEGGKRLGGSWLVLSAGVCLLGMASKEVMYAAPLVVLFYDRAFVAGTFAGAWRRRRWYYSALAATWLVLAALVLATGNRGGTAGFGVGVTPWTYAKAEFQAVTQYLWLCFWPHPLIFDYGVYWPQRLGEILPHALLVGALVVATGYCLVRRPALGLLGFWFFAILAPTSSFLPGNRQTLAEHRMYLPLAAVATLAVVAGHRALAGARLGRHWPIAGALALGGLAAAHCVLTLRRNQDYRSEIVLYRDTVAKRPGNAFAHYNLGKLLDESGASDAAIAHYREAIRLDPQRSAPYNNLGKTLAGLGRFDEAIEQYRVALRLSPGSARAHYNLGQALLELGRKEEARQHFAEAVRLRPDDIEARDNLGGVLLELGRVAEAIAHFEAVLRLDPNVVEARYMLGNALMLQGRAAEAIPHYGWVLRLKPDFDDARRNLELARRAAAAP